ncbi:MAG: potassium-transporting ATPase subunit KdpA [Chloroflexi bacterium RBG_13_50_21]|nr:MAG: potassium-transporting ATPase subunit KdpA [Chloroflexi bacterium RBG_13_50_21]
MLLHSYLQIGLYFVILLLLVKPLGLYMARVYQGESTFLDRIIRPIEHVFYRMMGVNPMEEMDWKMYAMALLVFSALSILVVYLIQRIQGLLPLNPQKFGATSSDLAFNTAVSFVTNTNWQNYGGETSLSYLTQMVGLTVQNFVSAAAGMAVLMAFIRSLARKQTTKLGNFWVDLTRGMLYILLPMAIIVALLLVSQGVVQTFSPYKQVTLLQPTSYQQPLLDESGNPVIDTQGNPVTESVPLSTQLLAVGPAASQIAIKQLGTNGGGFFNANSTHPFENPTPFSNFLEMLSILVIPAALTYTFGKMVGSTRQGWAILAAMLLLLWVPLGLALASEQSGNPTLSTLGVDQVASATNLGGNMEGKEVRFGITNSTLWATTTTAASNGSVNSMHDSYTPLGGLVPLWMMMLGEVSFGGVGSGMYGMLVFVIVAVFVAGLMVGRTPEYLGKKIEAYEIKMASLLILIMPVTVLVLTAIAVLTAAGKSAIFNAGPHGFSEALYLFTSQGNNNGSAFAGIGANNPFYNITGGIAMMIGRFFLAIPTLALAGSLVKKKKTPETAGTLPTHTLLFIAWLIAVVILVGALNFFPALALGPIIEHLML